MARNTYYVLSQGGDWKVTKVGTYANKDDAIEKAKQVAKANQPSQVVVQKADGTFQTEWTYGQDPFPTPG